MRKRDKARLYRKQCEDDLVAALEYLNEKVARTGMMFDLTDKPQFDKAFAAWKSRWDYSPLSDKDLRLTAKANAFCGCVSDFGPIPMCTICHGSGRDPAKWHADSIDAS